MIHGPGPDARPPQVDERLLRAMVREQHPDLAGLELRLAATGWTTNCGGWGIIVAGGTLAGVIDFGELCAGDPATDLAAAWLLLPTDAIAEFFHAYGTADAAMIRRARGWAVLFGVSLLSIGQAWDRGLPGGQPTWGRAGRRALHRLLVTSPDHLAPGE